jgi:hypothetical protein
MQLVPIFLGCEYVSWRTQFVGDIKRCHHCVAVTVVSFCVPSAACLDRDKTQRFKFGEFFKIMDAARMNAAWSYLSTPCHFGTIKLHIM